jgi:hypothetical protein
VIEMPNTSTGFAADQKHYQTAELQPIETMQMYLSHEEFIGFLKGNVLKYTLRAGHKEDAAKDLEKAAQYASWLQQAQRGQKINPREGAAK